MTGAATAGAAALVALVFLLRAGSTSTANWPVNWELRSSDNGVLFQVMQDVLAGRTLDWSFSPQVYVFPELPVSAAAYLLGGGDLYRYYLLVAAINAALLFLALFMLVSVIYRSASNPARLARAAIAFVPLALLPLASGAWLPSFHLAPTYYFGMYLMLFAAPAFFFVRRRPARVLLGLGLAFTVASNPLVLVFCGLPFSIVLIVVGVRNGFRAVVRPALAAAAVLVIALVVRLAFFSSLQGGSPLDYVDPDVFATRLANLGPYFGGVLADPAARVILVVGAVLAVLEFLSAIVVVVFVLRRRLEPEPRILSAVYFGLFPVLGLACTAIVMITHNLYFWPVVIAPYVIALLALPGRWSVRALLVAAIAFFAVVSGSGGFSTLASGQEYFGHRTAETECLDSKLPRGAVGYATFSDSRRLSLTSANDVRLVPLKSDLQIATWLTNLDYPRQFAGSFFYLNSAGDEPELSRGAITGLFGAPDSKIRCDGGHSVWIYTDTEALARIADHFASAPAIRHR